MVFVCVLVISRLLLLTMAGLLELSHGDPKEWSAGQWVTATSSLITILKGGPVMWESFNFDEPLAECFLHSVMKPDPAQTRKAKPTLDTDAMAKIQKDASFRFMRQQDPS